MSVVPSIIVLVITALFVFRRELAALLAAFVPRLLRRSSSQFQRQPGLNVIYPRGQAQNHAKRRRACH
jgi:hypothetical protein